MHREREIFDSEEGKALLHAWNLPETLRGVGAVALGYPAGEPGEPAPRKLTTSSALTGRTAGKRV